MGEVRGPEPADGRQALDAPTWMLSHHPAIQLVRQDFTTGAAARKALGRRLLEGGAFGLHQGGPCCGVVFVHVAPSRTASRWAELSISPSGNQRVHLAVRCAGLADTLGVDVWASFAGQDGRGTGYHKGSLDSDFDLCPDLVASRHLAYDSRRKNLNL